MFLNLRNKHTDRDASSYILKRMYDIDIRRKKGNLSNKRVYNFYVLKPKNADKYLLVIQKAKL